MKPLLSIYHYLWARLSSIWYRFPSRRIKVIGITGTKGKSTTAELISAILETADLKTALSSTVRFKVGEKSQDNKLKMSLPGRGFIQRFLRQAVHANCDWAIIEMTSEGARQFRHKFIDLNAFIFTNLAPEHIESHGSYEAYRQAKVGIARELERSPKAGRALIVNGDDKEAKYFSNIKAEKQIAYHLSDLEPIKETARGTEFNFCEQTIVTKLIGKFNLYNILAAMTFAETQGIAPEIIKEAVEQFGGVRGRMEQVGWQDFEVLVDYAHTPDSLRQVYEAFPGRKKICVLGGAGGGRDKWKRSEIGKIAEKHCDKIILTDEDPYDEDPEEIVKDITAGIKKAKPQVIMDRRLAIREAISRARAGDVVLITGKGTDPYIMGPNGSKTPWDDAAIAHEELEKLKTS
ncbi:MAG: UDP-N-acetylmuramoyl-L-alanyl-D-glutamate--2,6-diaminopimelate ligase [Patescibacteria group bacterium]|nr:UDP-N-acetylmuramoyl-L-alanyl-D-glutamate--2,6-diaminopimelate ligase [Patescibacteria group bacterium]